MTFSLKSLFDKISVWLTANKLRENVSIITLAFLICIPIFIYFRKNIFYFDAEIPIDKILIFLVLLSLFVFILKVFRKKIAYSISLYVIIFLIASTQGNYTLFQVINAYKIIFLSDQMQKEEAVLEQKTLKPFPNKTRVYESVDFLNSKVRNFALFAINKHFTKTPNYVANRKLIQYFAVFKEINARWNYVNDPKGQEYFASGSESLLYFSGDCDDHAILMCSAIKSIGGSMRLIHTGKHMYPELLIGTAKDLEIATYLISSELFPKQSKHKTIYFHRDERGKIWLNLDYTARYPGGPFLGEEVLSILDLQEPELTSQSGFFQ
ncbi:transglutaminase [Flavobacterium sp. F372]|uniref:Transglutaminase n=1 Tax=Flavobacterium bernardetii TaxID=2813823 RepID=A0ABR7IWJ1_9FLAO|nr:transglutaminase [Flavobacterium bernardetii]MBC5834150.1 transglutaminase [Flavobacterium bernardetii]NHF69382.1 transglutaminase [Flavobacterium bernardetii]